MKRFLLAGLLFLSLGAHASEVTEDYFDIATNYSIEGNYRQAIIYLDKILVLEPENKSVADLRNGLNQIYVAVQIDGRSVHNGRNPTLAFCLTKKFNRAPFSLLHIYPLIPKRHLKGRVCAHNMLVAKRFAKFVNVKFSKYRINRFSHKYNPF